MTSITNEQFNKQLEEPKTIKWRGLKDGKIYTITNFEYIKTKYGDPCILTLGDNMRVYAPSALINPLKQESDKPFPRYARPKGRVQCTRNPGHLCYGFDLV